MIKVAASIFQYSSLVVTSFLAVLSLFFKFTEEQDGVTVKKLTSVGKIAFLLIVVSAIIGLSSTIIKDVLDAQSKAESDAKYQNLLSETQLISKTFKQIKIKLTFDNDMSWRDDSFMSKNLYEGMCGSWVKLDVPGGGYADWCLSKVNDGNRLLGGPPTSVLYVDRRKEVIKEFIEQNYPSLINRLPDDLSFFASPNDAIEAKSEKILYLSEKSTPPVLGVHFSVPDPDVKITYVDSDANYKIMTFTINTQTSFTQLIDSVLRLDFYLTTNNVNIETTDDNGIQTIQKINIKSLPTITSQLKYIDVYIDDKLVRKVFNSADSRTKYEHESEFDWKQDRFVGHLFELKFDHDLIVEWQRATSTAGAGDDK